MTLVVASMLCLTVLLCIASFRSVLAFVALAALAVVSPFLCLGLLVALAAIYFAFTK